MNGVQVFGAAVLLASLSCSSTTGSPTIQDTGNGSCTTGGDAGAEFPSCTDFGAGFNAGSVMSDCTSQMATYSASPCPTASRVARCELSQTMNGGSAAAVVNFYPPVTAAQVMQVCSMDNGEDGVTTTYEAD
jgi:hypothetical protein